MAVGDSEPGSTAPVVPTDVLVLPTGTQDQGPDRDGTEGLFEAMFGDLTSQAKEVAPGPAPGSDDGNTNLLMWLGAGDSPAHQQP
jgi:hypothetical protein